MESFDLFGLDRANEGMKVQEEKIRAAKEYQESLEQKRQKAYNDPNILQY